MLAKNLSFFDGLVIAVSMVVGTGLFGLPGLAIQATDPVTALFGWGTVIVLMPPVIHIFSYLGQYYPASEGLSLYASMGLGAWSKKGVMLITCGTLVIGMPAFFLVGGSYVARLFGLDAHIWAVPCTIALAIVTTIINLAGLEKMGTINRIVVALVLITVAGITLVSLPGTVEEYRRIDVETVRHVSLAGVWLAATVVFWAFMGWENMTFGFGEIKNPQRNIPRIFWLSFVLVASIYAIFAAVASAGALQGKNVSGLAGVASLLPDGIAGKILLSVMVLLLVANANSWVFGSSRAFYAAAQAGLLPRSWARVNARGIPANSLKGALVVYIVLILAQWALHLKEELVFMLTTQGFILLYGGTIVAYMKISRGVVNRLVGIVAVLSCVFLMHGFGWMMMYPAALFALGVLMDRKKPSNQR